MPGADPTNPPSTPPGIPPTTPPSTPPETPPSTWMSGGASMIKGVTDGTRAGAVSLVSNVRVVRGTRTGRAVAAGGGGGGAGGGALNCTS